MAVKKMKNWTRKKIQENYDFDLLPKVRSNSSSSCCGVDRISELPDDLIRSTVSLLTPREAAVAATLSSSWRRVDAVVVSVEFPTRYPYNYNTADAQKSGFLECTALEYSCKAKFFVKFKFDLSHYDPYERDNLINFADWFESAAAIMSSSSMEFVDIHVISVVPRYGSIYRDYYRRHPPCPPNPFKIIAETEEYRLKLREVSLSGDGLVSSDIDLLLTNLVALERLSIEFSVYRDHFYIGRPEIKTKLKHLKITPSFSINKFFSRVFISHLDNLVSLSYNGFRTDLDHVPKLADATVHSSTRNIGDVHPRIAAQLLRLRLYFPLVSHKTMLNYGKFTKLKHLELNVELDSETNIQYLCPLIEAFPCIHELKVKFLWLCDPACKHKRRHDGGDPIPMMNRMSEMSRLQVVKVSGCVGSVFELEFALYVINNASTLKELVLEPGDRNNLIQSIRIDGAFQHLLSVAPSYVDLIML